MKYSKNKKNEEKSMARERIIELFEQAEKRPSMANRYVAIARKISTRLKVKIPKLLKSRFCKKCGSHLKPGLNARIRLNKGKRTITCLVCQNKRRTPYKA